MLSYQCISIFTCLSLAIHYIHFYINLFLISKNFKSLFIFNIGSFMHIDQWNFAQIHGLNCVLIIYLVWKFLSVINLNYKILPVKIWLIQSNGGNPLRNNKFYSWLVTVLKILDTFHLWTHILFHFSIFFSQRWTSNEAECSVDSKKLLL